MSVEGFKVNGTVHKYEYDALEDAPTPITLDATLTRSDAAAPADKVGELLSKVSSAYSAFATDIAVGAIASFPDGADGIPVKNLTVEIKPSQSGSGDPSPDNVRPISGWTGANVHVSPTTNAADGTTHTITFPSEAGTVYGGTLDVTTGNLTVDMAIFNLSELNWYYDGDNIFAVNMVGKPIKFLGRGVCSHYKVVQVSSWRDVGNMQMSVTNSQAVPILRIHNNDAGTDANVFKQSLVGVEFICETTQTISYQLTPTEVKTLLGTNNVWADCGDTTVQYRADTALYVEKKLAGG